MRQLTFIAESIADTERLGAALAAVLPDGTTVALCGTLGAGKTRLVQAIAAACGVPREVVSPTFVLCQQYQGRRTLYHLDAYRLRDDDDFLQLGPEEFFAAPAITLIEWADRVRNCLPPEHIEIQMEITGETTRRFHITASGEAYRQVIDSLHHQLT